MQYSRVVASKFDKDSFITVMPETFGAGTSGSYNGIELFHPYGFAARPIDRDEDNNACSLLSMVDGPQGYAILLNDGRIQSLLPEIKQGESFQYGPTGNFVRCHADGRVSMFTTDDATPNGRTVALSIGPAGLVFNAPWGNLKFDPTGFHVLHSSGARIDLGACGGLPAPLSALASYATLSAAVTHVEGSVVNVGASSPTSEPAAKAIQVTLALGALQTALDSVALALSAIGAIGVNGAAAGATATAVTAITTAQGAIAGFTATIPSLGPVVA